MKKYDYIYHAYLKSQRALKEIKMFTKKDESIRRFQLFSKEIEDQLDKLLADRKLEIVKILVGRVKFLKEEAEKKIERTRDEIYQEKKELKHCFGLIAEQENLGDEIRGKIDAHAGQVTQYKKEILKLADAVQNEMQATNELGQQFDQLQKDTLEKATSLKNQLQVKYGIETKLPESDIFKEKTNLDVAGELDKIGKIKKLIEPAEFPSLAEKAAEKEYSYQPIEKKDLETAFPS
jgi:regulator of PEP synthase PpsR (kinase-PPPase family)